MPKGSGKKTVEALTHDEATRKNIPTAEYQSVMKSSDDSPLRAAYERRNKGLGSQLVWREKVNPKVLVDELVRRTKAAKKEGEAQIDHFWDFYDIAEIQASEVFL